MTAADAIKIIENADNYSKIFITLHQDDISNNDLGKKLGISTNTDGSIKKSITDGTYICNINGKVVTVEISIANDVGIELTVDAKSNSTVDLTHNWKWAIETDKKGIIDWGDGIITTDITDVISLTHQYINAGTYTIKIKNISFKGSDGSEPSADGREANLPILSIKFIKKQIITNPNYLFCYMKKLKEISGILKIDDKRAGGTLQFMFKDCEELENISDLTVIYNDLPDTIAVSLVRTFENCKKLTYDTLINFKLINWKASNCNNYYHTFFGCKKLTSIPTQFFDAAHNSYDVKMDSTFMGTGIKYLPNNIINNIQSTNTWSTFDLGQLKNVSPLLTLPKFTGGYLTFNGCNLTYNAVKTIYDALPDLKSLNPDYEGTFENGHPKQYTIYFGINESQPNIGKRLRKLFGIPDEVYTAWGDIGLPNAKWAQFFIEEKKGWRVTFSSPNTHM